MAKPYERRTRFYPNPRRPFERMISLETPIRPGQLEERVDNLLWEMVAGRAKIFYEQHIDYTILFTFKDTYTDKAVKGVCASFYGIMVARVTNDANFYELRLEQLATSADFAIAKYVAGSRTVLATEAIDFPANIAYLCKLEIEGSILRVYREDMTTPKITATDTTFTSGYFGARIWGAPGGGECSFVYPSTVQLVDIGSADPPEPIRYYEIPVIGDGSFEDPFRPQLPEEIADHPRFGKINRLAFTWSAIIPTNRKTGKPIEYVVPVEIYPTRPEYCRSLSESFEVLEAISGVKRLSKDEFERRKKRLLEL